jgi:thiol-disulfide isomerase/thioredoxin
MKSVETCSIKDVTIMRTAILALLFITTSWVALADDAPRPAPPFTIMRAGGPPIQISQFKGKVVALILMNPTCPHCQALTKAVGPIAAEYAPKGVQFLECAFNPNPEQAVAQFIQQFQPAFPVGWSTDPAVRMFLGYSAMDTRLSYVPHMVFLDAHGMIRDDFPAESELFKTDAPGTPEIRIRAELDKLLKSGATTTSAGTGVKKK